MRQFSGFGSAKDTNARFHYLLKNGQTGLSVAFDMPTLMGYDSDHTKSLGEVGKCGVAIDTVEDMALLFNKIPLHQVSVSMTINGPAIVLFAMYLVVAERQGVSFDHLRGTLQNDILKEFIAQKEWIVPPAPSLSMINDTIRFCVEEAPLFHPVSISGYHIREAGSTAIQELAFTLFDGLTYVASANPNPNSVNPYNTGAGLCFDCHETADATSTPWGYNATFGATAPIIGYMDNPHFKGGYSGRYSWRTAQGFVTLGGHLRPSHENPAAPNYDPSADVPTAAPINGLCTPCHDPHGVSPSLGDDMAYAVPLLKGTWLTSPYKEDDPPADTSNYHRYSPMLPTWNTDRAIPTWTVPDKKIFPDGAIAEDADRFAGLCLSCHAKDDLTDGVDKNTAWKSVDRIHESVKGWGNNAEHNYPCSKCHKPHSSGLPRLLRTNCLDGKHRGKVLSGGTVKQLNVYRTFPTGGVNGVSWRPACHESPQAGGGAWNQQEWNTVSPW